ncbi:MAG: transglutaminase domain-containing protein [Bacteroidota bacterium]|nr:transglutaminase domain-containing protein [Bacteroidota bacterium]
MGIDKVNNYKKVIAQLILLAIPTLIFVFFLLWRVNSFYSILQNDYLKQGLYFGIGAIVAIVFYSYRFRFTTTTVILFALNYFIYKLLGNITTGEFDAFYVSIQFLIFNILFSVGWLVGFGFSRSKYFTIGWSVLMLAVQIVVISKTSDFTVSRLISDIVPVLAYTFYIIYTAELIRNMNENEAKFTWFITKRLSGFAVIILLLFFMIFNLFKGDFKAVEKEWGGSSSAKGPKGQDGGNGDNNGGGESMTQKDKGGAVSNKDQSKLSGSLNKDKQLIFVAKLDNFFDDGRTPNPLYFTSCYYSKFDTATQTFETDINMPYNDLFSPDPSKIPLYFKKTDQSIIKKSLGVKNRKTVTAEIYNVNLSPNVYLAPSNAFYCQPISVPKEYKDQFRSAYSAKMWVSELNSAYFIYNPAGNRELERFQEQRFQKLREVKTIVGPDKAFMDYYTYMPVSEDYNKIKDLAINLTKDKEAPIDKILALRDYFLSKDEFDQPLFQYSDNPGIPGMPSANKLTYFLLENRKGYCAYFAGATLFMLRAIGIPSRVVAGFSVVDRSSKNPGWYWFYQDQAHAWVQVYFPEYGWIDFDTTVPDVNTQQAPQPDGTPPTDMPKTYLVVDGIIESVNEKTKSVTVKTDKLLFHDKDFGTSKPEELTMDVSLATISCDTGEVKIEALKKKMHITAASQAEIFKNILPGIYDNFDSVVTKLPKILPIDEIKILPDVDKQKQKEKKQMAQKEGINWKKVLLGLLFVILFLGMLVLFSPQFIWLWFNSKAKRENKMSAYWRYRASLYYLNQLGYKQEEMGPRQFSEKVDMQFSTNFLAFSNVYQKLKYSTDALSENETRTLNEFYTTFIKQVKSKTGFKTRFKKFFNLNNTIHYFTQPKIN